MVIGFVAALILLRALNLGGGDDAEPVVDGVVYLPGYFADIHRLIGDADADLGRLIPPVDGQACADGGGDAVCRRHREHLRVGFRVLSVFATICLRWIRRSMLAIGTRGIWSRRRSFTRASMRSFRRCWTAIATLFWMPIGGRRRPAATRPVCVWTLMPPFWMNGRPEWGWAG